MTDKKAASAEGLTDYADWLHKRLKRSPDRAAVYLEECLRDVAHPGGKDSLRLALYDIAMAYDVWPIEDYGKARGGERDR